MSDVHRPDLDTSFEKFPGLFWRCDARGRLELASPQLLKLTGRPERALAGERWIEAVHADDRALLEAAWTRARFVRKSWRADLRLQAADGQYRWVRARANAHLDSDGRLTGWMVSAHELDEGELLWVGESEARFRTLFTSMDEGFQLCEVIYDEHGKAEDYRFLEVNPAFERHVGVPRERLIGRTVRQVLPCIERHWIEVCARVAETGLPERYENFAHGGGRYYEVFAFCPKKGQFASISIDVTDRKRFEDALRESEALARQRLAELEALYETSPVGLCVLDEGLHWVRINKRMAEMNGKPIEEHIGKTPKELLPDLGAQAENALRTVMSTGERLDFELTGTTGATPGVQRTWTEHWVPIRDSEGRVTGVSVAAEDISEQRSAEEAVRQANERLVDADHRKNEFLAMLSHELRNPLAPIRNSVYVLERAAPGGEQATRARQVIDRQAQQMTRLIDDLLDVTRISRGKITLRRERIELRALVRGTGEDHRDVFTRGGIALDIDATGEPLWVNGDPTRLAQVVGNLLSNALKFTPRGGRTTVSVGDDGDSRAVVRVRDTGAGMSPRTLLHVFEPFVQAAETIERTRGGLGLGLALVKGLIELHGGEVSAHSDGEGKGSELVFSLPLEASARPRLTVVGDDQRRTSPRRVLVIEDNVDAAESLREALELEDHEVEVAYSGTEGIAAVHRHVPDVVLCDIGLPGIDGYGVARALRVDDDPRVRSSFLVALSGYALQEDVAKATEAGFDRHLAKPLSIDTLERLLAETPARPASGAARGA